MSTSRESPPSGDRTGKSRRRKHMLPRLRTRKPPGTAPGTLAVEPGAPPPRITVMAYGPDELVEEQIDDLGALQRFRDRHPVVWINVDGLGDQDVLTEIGQQFRIHMLALEDVVNVHQRAKLEPYEDQLFIIARMARVSEHLETEQVSMFVGDGFVLTFQERVGDDFDLVRQRLRTGRPRIRCSGPDYLAYALLDALIDAYYPILEAYGERLEALEERVMRTAPQPAHADIHVIKRELLKIRRSIWPHRELLATMLREESGLIAADTRIFLRDCHDHVITVIDMVETYREIASGLMDLYLSSVSNRMNEVMKVLTIFAAIFIPLGFIAGLYGMNFDTASGWNMPELSWPFGYAFALGLMATVAGSLLLFFRYKRWIGK